MSPSPADGTRGARLPRARPPGEQSGRGQPGAWDGVGGRRRALRGHARAGSSRQALFARRGRRRKQNGSPQPRRRRSPPQTPPPTPGRALLSAGLEPRESGPGCARRASRGRRQHPGRQHRTQPRRVGLDGPGRAACFEPDLRCFGAGGGAGAVLRVAALLAVRGRGGGWPWRAALRSCASCRKALARSVVWPGRARGLPREGLRCGAERAAWSCPGGSFLPGVASVEGGQCCFGSNCWSRPGPGGGGGLLVEKKRRSCGSLGWGVGLGQRGSVPHS